MIRPIFNSKFNKSMRSLRLSEMPVSNRPKIASIDFDDIKDFVSEHVDSIPVAGSAYRGYKVVDSICEGDAKGVINNGIAALDSGIKTTVATAAASAAVIGGPVASAAAYSGTVVAWNKTRKKVIDVAAKEGPDIAFDAIVGLPGASKSLPKEIKKELLDSAVKEIKEQVAITKSAIKIIMFGGL